MVMTKRKQEKPGNQELSRGSRYRDRAARAQAQRPGHKFWIYGRHTVQAALESPTRRHHRMLATRNAGDWLTGSQTPPEIVSAQEIARHLPADAVHQGIALLVSPRANPDLGDVCRKAGEAVIVILDQVTDPQNIGSVLRSCAAFGAAALVVQDRHSPPETGVLAKAASGALERVPIIRVVNIARALEQLGEWGYTRLGLDDDADTPLMNGRQSGPTVLILGAEGKGLRRLTKRGCDQLIRIPTTGAQASLNVSNAAAIALYALTAAQP